MNLFKYSLKRVLFMLLLVVGLSSCGVSKIGEQIELRGVESFELKGLTAVELRVGLLNDSKYPLEMSEGVVELYIGGEHIMQLGQVGVASCEARSEGSVKTLWRIGGVDPLSLLSYSGRLMSGDFSGMTIDYSAKFKAGKISKNYSEKGVDLSNFISTFANIR